MVRKEVIFLAAFVVFIAFNLAFSGGRIGYDMGRNEKIITELAYYGTFTYFDVAFIASPPLYHITHSVPVALFGGGQTVFIFTEALLYFIGALLVVFIVREFLPGKKGFLVGLLAFGLLLVDKNMFSVQGVDFWGIMLLVSSLLLLTYIRMFKRAGGWRLLAFGIVVGVAMLVKSSFIFLIIPLLLHWVVVSLVRMDWKKVVLILIPLVIGIIVYSPWMLYLTSNGFPIITNPEAQGELPWDPNFTGYSFQDIYLNILTYYWVILYPFSILLGVYLIAERYFSVRFEKGVRLRSKLKYFFYKHGNILSHAFIVLMAVILLLPFFNRLFVVIPVGEQFLSIGLAMYIIIGIVFFKAKRKEVRYLIAAVLVVNLIWGWAGVVVVPAGQEHQDTCGLYTEFFSSLGPDKALLIDEKLSRITYPAHNVMYQAFFEWFSYQEQYDLSRILTMNIDYVVLIDSERVPEYLNSSVFVEESSFVCEDLRGKPPYHARIFRVAFPDAIALGGGFGRKAEFTIHGGGRPIQAAAVVKGDGFVVEYKSKRNGSLVVYFPVNGSFSMDVSRPGFKSRGISLEEIGDRLINLERDSPFITHTTANRF